MEENKQARTWPGWLIATIVALAVFNGLPFLAPVFMKLGWEAPGRALYFLYGLMCHQMAQRSFFLFGPGGFQMYSIAELSIDLSGLSPAASMLALRQIWGSADIGWKVAWSDRMVYMYVSPLLVAIIYGFLRKRGPVRPLSVGAFLALLLPMALDGGSHWLSDIAGIGQGFRDSNLWLATLTNHILPASFYAGDALGSFNSLMRLVSGVSFGVAIGGLLFPWIDLSMAHAEPALAATSEAGLAASQVEGAHPR